VEYERRIEIVTREWTDRGTTEPMPHVVVVGYIGLLFSWLLSRVAVPVGLVALGMTLVLAFGLAANRPDPKRLYRTRPVRVKLTEHGITVEDEGTIPADLIASAYVQPNGAEKPLVVARAHDGKAIFQAVADDEADAARMLEAIGRGPQQHRTLFVASSPLTRFVGGFFPLGLATLLGAIAVALPFGGTPFVRMVLGSAAFIAGFAYSMGPRRIEVGTEGMLVSWRGREQYIRFDDITAVERSGSNVHVKVGKGRLVNIAFGPHEERVAEAFEYRLRTSSKSASGEPSPAAARLLRGARSLAEWRASLARTSEVSYRDAGVSSDDLWQIVHDPSASEEARAAAAVLLRNRPDAPPRLRIAAESAASPRLRVALEAAADPEAKEEEILDRFAS
jgi:hypothetical protein